LEKIQKKSYFRALKFLKIRIIPIAGSPLKVLKTQKILFVFAKIIRKKRNDEKPFFTKLSEIEMFFGFVLNFQID